METHDFKTRLPLVECRERLASRVGKPRWRFVWVGIAYATDAPLSGHVDERGFEITENHASESSWWFEDPTLRFRGKWTGDDNGTYVEVEPRLSRWQWFSDVWYGLVLGAVLTVMLLAIMQSMSALVVGLTLVGMVVLIATGVSILTHRAAPKRAVKMMAKLERLLEADELGITHGAGSDPPVGCAC